METNNLVPKHIAVILDGNGRWAKRRGLPRSEGHAEGARRVTDLLESCRRWNIEYVTLYAFSTENWKRSEEEVNFLMDLLARYLDENVGKMLENKTRLLVTGRMEELPEFCVQKLKSVIEKTSVFYERTLILALNYGGRQEITDAVRKIAVSVRNQEINPENISEDMISKNMYLPEVPDPDYMIRTSGEVRLSNFLLWELSYAEFYFTETCWPDFKAEDFDRAMREYQKRNRRFGGRP